ncbi:pyruvate, phosphate dikinase [Anaeromyxobacter oryzae]|uniref:Pyruvate, phosphate dikinase n=1 Tax=Anaeromyxobacter oryzae TaxID=2918170 RepID=A0ABM7WWV2_9BACT|nr:pyruvate, phosphate dikinase [Anaeromyxobacter oryzae]BDG03968.1 pyruvate, phosphate dikinase [Anaeromyxobacter oryzae]
MATKRIYSFGGGKADGNKDMKDVLGGKGAGLAEMSNIGIPVPPGFTITTDVCTEYYRAGKKLPRSLEPELRAALRKVEALTGKGFGDAGDPLLVSVRSGARVSMPGMMDTVLNLGLNDRTVEGLAARSGNPRFAWDSYRRFVAMFGDVVLGMKPETKEDRDPFEVILTAKKEAFGAAHDADLPVEALRELVSEFKAEISRRKKVAFPEEPFDQLLAAVGAVFRSWDNDRAIAYRQLNGIPAEWGTAVSVQAMVFGNMGDDSGTGVAFTRNPATGEDEFYGEFLVNAQGEDVVAGIRTPQKIGELQAKWADVSRQLLAAREKLEHHYRDMQDIEFTIERGRLYLLQTRSGKRTGLAAVRIAVEMAEQRLISREDAILRVDAEALNHLLRPVFDEAKKAAAVKEGRLLAKGLPAGPGAASGRLVFFAEDAAAWRAKGEQVVLARHETSPEDIRGMAAAEGFLTAFGGMTSHAALVARQMGKVAIVGCDALSFDYHARTMTVTRRAGGDVVLKEGHWISIDGLAGEVIDGRLETRPSEVVEVLVEKTRDARSAPTYQRFAKLLSWADGARRLKVRANADQPDQARVAVAFGAQGIGLCRTEHMFFGEGKIGPMREMIVAATPEERRAALAKLLPLQREDFRGLFVEMAGRPVTIRTLDPPLHEFLPHDEEGMRALAEATGKSVVHVEERIEELAESNPMLGNRGCRLGIAYPEITEMQVRAIFEAAIDAAEAGARVEPEVMIPLVGMAKELDHQAAVVRRVAQEVFAARGRKVRYLVGTMIEVPRGAVTAAEIARTAEFFSFGTNDLTQTTFGLSRDDVGPVLARYLEEEILAVDPFVSIDQDGVGALMRLGVAGGRATRPELKIGICGEHGGDPASVGFCHRLGLDYVSCSPYRLPIARLAAAQAALREAREAASKRRAGANGKRAREGRIARDAKAARNGKTRDVAVASPAKKRGGRRAQVRA